MAKSSTTASNSVRARSSEAREYSKRILDDPEYRNKLLERARNGSLPPQIEQILYYYAFGKPVENIAVNVTEQPQDLSHLTDEELNQREELITRALRAVDAKREPDPQEPPKPLIH